MIQRLVFADVASAVACTTITLNGFTVPAGETLKLNLASGTKVTMAGDILFGNKSWAGPLFSMSGTGITFDGQGHKFDDGGPFYWDGLGGNGGIQKPDPMMNIGGSGTIENVRVVNSPERAWAISNNAPMTLTGVTVDNSQGDAPNANSAGKPAGANTDGFDVVGNNISILKSTVHNQDDCLAINGGTNIVFSGNSCTNSHGISVGSIGSDATVSGVVISGNTIINNVQGLRIKTKATATGSTVSNITFTGNTATGCTEFGVLIDQSYPATLGTPGTGVILSDVNFGAPATSISVGSSAKRVAVNCGVGSCTGTWNWANLEVSGGVAGSITNFAGITGFSE
ncbi:glycoside hydrolase family 28 protein [Hypholoma sublateritium FD-334 SS-4]|uniref:endo-polygalacturonase n=1 Tax=Hypholoma sublateritium (strain FD-334 SS-4) TaxID=945553 RepID=A0A0D2NU21_HYPSF|nr:glycoside hydrolase family 28 protein [Hypholoma sublateritium FD-334 SS-4]